MGCQRNDMLLVCRRREASRLAAESGRTARREGSQPGPTGSARRWGFHRMHRRPGSSRVPQLRRLDVGLFHSPPVVGQGGQSPHRCGGDPLRPSARACVELPDEHPQALCCILTDDKPRAGGPLPFAGGQGLCDFGLRFMTVVVAQRWETKCLSRLAPLNQQQFVGAWDIDSRRRIVAAGDGINKSSETNRWECKNGPRGIRTPNLSTATLA